MKFMIGNWSNILACIKPEMFYRRWSFHVHRRSYVVRAFKRPMTSVGVPDGSFGACLYPFNYLSEVLIGCSNDP